MKRLGLIFYPHKVDKVPIGFRFLTYVLFGTISIAEAFAARYTANPSRSYRPLSSEKVTVTAFDPMLNTRAALSWQTPDDQPLANTVDREFQVGKLSGISQRLHDFSQLAHAAGAAVNRGLDTSIGGNYERKELESTLAKFATYHTEGRLPGPVTEQSVFSDQGRRMLRKKEGLRRDEAIETMKRLSR